MEEEKKEQKNPEVVATAKVEDETITVKVLIKGKPGEADAKFFTVEGPKIIASKLDNPIFSSLVDPVKSHS